MIVGSSNQKCGISVEVVADHLDTVQDEIVPEKSHHISRNLSGFGKSLAIIIC